ncbi:hypothetical protein F5Y18DRAFT_288594 [Xylariaceae sp. FL1019]|nr:hypothetical protein F5Y18DRAFT_288594 [Xylariaceae sp. FL1019]
MSRPDSLEPGPNSSPMAWALGFCIRPTLGLAMGLPVCCAKNNTPNAPRRPVPPHRPFSDHMAATACLQLARLVPCLGPSHGCHRRLLDDQRPSLRDVAEGASLIECWLFCRLLQLLPSSITPTASCLVLPSCRVL